MYQTIGFIGTGNMGSAVAQAAAHSGLAARLLLANRTPEKARDLVARLEGGWPPPTRRWPGRAS